MAWDFSTDPEFEEQLAWVRGFVKEEVGPLDLLFPHLHHRVPPPWLKRVIDPLKSEVKRRGLWACHLGPELGGKGFGQVRLSRWTAQLNRYQTRPLPEFGFVAKWLEANRPAMSPAGILHGDYSPFNVMVAPGPPARLAAIVDWDTGTIGDPLLDIGHLLGRWTEPGEEPVIGVQAGQTRATR